MSNCVLLEILSEEVPAKMQADFCKELQNRLTKRLENTDVKGFYTPRRATFMLNNVHPKTEITRVRGPRTGASIDAIDGFLRKHNIKQEDLIEEDGFYFVIQNDDTDLKSQIKKILEEELLAYIWPKSMRWGGYNARWIRPIHNILCLLNDEILPIQFYHLTANNKTRGHRMLGNQEIAITSIDEYFIKLQNERVILDQKMRLKMIEEQISEALKKVDANLQLKQDQALLEEIVGLVEYPNIFLSQIPDEFMQLPPEVLITTLKNNQKYLLVEDRTGRLAPYFIITANIIPSDNGDAIIAGNNKVTEARLRDALFFYNLDRKQTLLKWGLELGHLTFYDNITTKMRIERTKEIAHKISHQYNVNIEKLDRAIELYKADLLTNMVKEFPELQGIIGYYYALEDQEDSEVALSIIEHYKPAGPNDSLPSTPIGIVLALSDKIFILDTLFGAGIKPSGSKDPYALRRNALGINRIITHYNIKLNWEKLNLHPETVYFIERKA